jgi:DNA-binding SARP family transcriptional activator
MVDAWSELLMLEDGGDELEALLQSGLRLDPTRERLVRRLHRFYLRRNDPVQARKIIEQYRQALLADDYAVEEATDLVLSMAREER